MKTLDSDFSPSLLHPFYFIRRGLRDSVHKYSQYLSGTVMDFGCGSKPYQSFFKVDEYIGVDFENAGHPHDNEQIDVFYNGRELPFDDKKFDSILCSEVFEHLFNLEDLLKELNRVLKLNGNILITCPFVWNEHEVPFDYARYSRFALQHILTKSGFEIIEFTKSGTFVTTIIQLITLYFFVNFKGPLRKFFLTRWLYKVLLFFMPNLLGLFLNAVLPKNNSLYLNNVVAAKKVRENEKM